MSEDHRSSSNHRRRQPVLAPPAHAVSEFDLRGLTILYLLDKGTSPKSGTRTGRRRPPSLLGRQHP